VALFLATIVTTLLAGFEQSDLREHARTLSNVVRGGLPFAGTLVAILFTHEMGHYVLARRHGVQTTLPYFIPVPFGAGTLGAVIRMRSVIPSRRAVLDIGAAGPLAGLAVAVPLYLVGLSLSEVHTAPTAQSPLSMSLLSMIRTLVSGESLFPEAATVPQFFGESLITWAARWLVVGRLQPGTDVFLHPVAVAAWIGLLVTTLNLAPVGQLDGGHVLYALFGRRRALLVARLVSLGLLLAGLFVSWNWFLWWLLSRFVVGLGHPPALQEEELGGGRRAVAWASLALFVATFVPVPVSF
ncbi:MAG TPA: site-2 protease family protein, partial [Anaeromyxobacter sp.]